MSNESERNTHEMVEFRYSCPVCLSPRLKMVTGMCQHRMCTGCLYNREDGTLKTSMSKCPTCQKPAVFPLKRPDIPEDNILIQKMLGVTQCPNTNCFTELWEWELSDHLKKCSHAPVKIATLRRKSPRSSRSMSVLSPTNNETKIFQHRTRSQRLAKQWETVSNTHLRK
ncbi:TNF receptor-associated factor 6-like [Limulus polyphemus]|uniref:TNF receptor-associated factor 6-like n=1 Tax=Limulus polyphemus TaxID=6850 RepID=A0ABM1BJW0_LIMPO|nr:TNF receptor-associated factor 6-like [Limulus polyphemus]